MMAWLLKPVSRRRSALLGVLDQGLSSGTNFVIVIGAAKLLDKVDFGAFSVVFVTYSIVIGGYQAFIGQDLVLVVGARRYLAARCVAACRTAVILSIPVSLILLAWGMFDVNLRGSLFIFAAFLASLAVHETVRFVAALLDAIQLAVLIDVMRAAAVVIFFLLAGLDAFGEPNASLITLLWCASATVALVPLIGLAPRIRKFWFDPSRAFAFKRDYLGYRFFGEFLAVRATGQGLTILLAGMAGLTATGALRGTTTLFGPLNVLLTAVVAFTIPILRRLTPSARDRWTLALASALSALSALLLLVLLNIPAEAGRLLLGETWAGTALLIGPVGGQTVALSVSTVCVIAIRMIDPTSTLWVRLVGAVVTVIFFFAGFVAGGVPGAAWGLCAATIVQALLLAGVYVRLRRRSAAL